MLSTIRLLRSVSRDFCVGDEDGDVGRLELRELWLDVDLYEDDTGFGLFATGSSTLTLTIFFFGASLAVVGVVGSDVALVEVFDFRGEIGDVDGIGNDADFNGFAIPFFIIFP